VSAERVAVISGGAGGIGAATGERLAARGFAVLVVDRDEAAATAAAERIGGGASACAADVSREDDVRGYVAAALERYGRIDAFFNNAGIEGVISNVEDYPVDVFDQVLAVNLRGIFLGLKHVVPVMREQGSGAILNTASQAGVRGVPGLSAYVASKHGVVGISQGVALEVAAAGIRVNCLCPGPTETRMMEDIKQAVRAAGGDPQNFVDRMPVGRFGEPGEIADVAAWALSEAPPFMTGAVLTVDGAMTTP
jgi:NAD(P)-dependent dehydrogenase (short-subunit alcohol dehydrogenase family)